MSRIARHGKGRRFSRIVVHNGTAYFAGITAGDLSGDIQSQTEQVLAKADTLLESIGATRSSLLDAIIWLRDMDDFAAMNEVWEKWIDAVHPPARATVESQLAASAVKVEIKFTAAVA